jgi:NitT/TauT family transport system substrate-binding protein
MADDRASALATNRLALMWTLQAQFAGYIVAREEFSGLELMPRAPDRSPTVELLEGRAEYGVLSPAHLLAAPREGPELVLIALFMARSPVRLVGIRERVGPNLAPRGDLRVGIWSGEDLELRAMLRLAGVELADTEFIGVSDEAEALLSEEVDYVQATTYNELPAIAAAAGGLERLVAHDPADWNVDVPKDGLAARSEMLQADPERVQRFVRAAVDGWRRTLADPERALAAVLRAAPELDAGAQRTQLDAVLALFDSAHPLGEPRIEDIERARRAALAAADPRAETPVRVDAGPWERARG